MSRLTTSKQRQLQSQQMHSCVDIIRSTPLLLLLSCLLIIQHIPCADATLRVNLGDAYPNELQSFGSEFPSQPANFGLMFERGVEYDADLFMPITDLYFCGDNLDRLRREILETVMKDEDEEDGSEHERIWKDVLEENTLDVKEEKYSEVDKEVNRWRREMLEQTPSDHQEGKDSFYKSNQNTLLRQHQRRQFEAPPTKTIALLVSRGKCSFESKARTAMSLNDYYFNIFQGSPPVYVSYVIVHNDVIGDNNPILMDGPEKGIDVGLVFVTTSIGYKLKTLLMRVALDQKTSPFLKESSLRQVFGGEGNTDGGGSGAGSKGTLFNFPITITNPRGEKNESRNRDRFYWVRFILFAMLIITPFLRAVFLWYNAGGRIQWRRTRNGWIIGLRVVQPRRRWVHVGWRVPPYVDDDDERHGNGGKLSQEEVMALPEFEYGANNEDDEESGNVARGDSSTVGAVQGDILGKKRHGHTDDKDDTASTFHAAETVIASNITSTDNADQGTEQTEEFATSCTMCSICIDEFEPGEMLRLLPKCRHAFHTDCILPWLTERQGCCPLCKTPVLGDGTAESEMPESAPNNESIEMIAVEGTPVASAPPVEVRSPSSFNALIEESRSTRQLSERMGVGVVPEPLTNEQVQGHMQHTTNQNTVEGAGNVAGVTAISGGAVVALTTMAATQRSTNDHDEDGGSPPGNIDETGDGNQSLEHVQRTMNQNASQEQVRNVACVTAIAAATTTMAATERNTNDHDEDGENPLSNVSNDDAGNGNPFNNVSNYVTGGENSFNNVSADIEDDGNPFNNILINENVANTSNNVSNESNTRENEVDGTSGDTRVVDNGEGKEQSNANIVKGKDIDARNEKNASDDVDDSKISAAQSGDEDIQADRCALPAENAEIPNISAVVASDQTVDKTTVSSEPSLPVNTETMASPPPKSTGASDEPKPSFHTIETPAVTSADCVDRESLSPANNTNNTPASPDTLEETVIEAKVDGTDQT